MKYVIDSNCLRDGKLQSFLQSSRLNVAILTDYAVIEALKGNALVGMYESMKILARFPSQVQILKTTSLVCSLSGVSKGLQRRLLDVPRTKEFGLFCKNLTLARFESIPLTRQLQELGKEAQLHLSRVESDAIDFAALITEITRFFPQEERRYILSSNKFPRSLLHKLLVHVIQLATVIFSIHPRVCRLPFPEEVSNTYIFRSSLCHLLLGFQYAAVGGISGKSPARIRNDMVDSHFATYATFFDGIFSHDHRSNGLYSLAHNILLQFRNL